jgi:hypothetical protein
MLNVSSPVQDLKTENSDRFIPVPCMYWENDTQPSTSGKRNGIKHHNHGKKGNHFSKNVGIQYS